MLFGFGTTEVIIVVLLLLFLFGGRKLPEFIKGLGNILKEFRKGMTEDK